MVQEEINVTRMGKIILKKTVDSPVRIGLSYDEKLLSPKPPSSSHVV